MTNCAAMLADKLCPEHMQAFMTCALSKPERDWECTPDQVAAVKDGVCDREQRDFIMCAQREASRDLLAR